MEFLKLFQGLSGDKMHVELYVSLCEERYKQTFKSGSLTDLCYILLMLTVLDVVTLRTILTLSEQKVLFHQ